MPTTNKTMSNVTQITKGLNEDFCCKNRDKAKTILSCKKIKITKIKD
jgi:hypothetical protein